MNTVKVLFFVLVLSICAIACQNRPPEVKILTASYIGDMEAVAVGYARGVSPIKFGVVVYIKVRGYWWIKPYLNDPITSLVGPLWFCDITTGGVDEEATIVRAYLWDYSWGEPPLVSMGMEIPIDESVPFAEIERK